MGSPDDAPYMCMSDKRCRLCHFGLQEGDLVVARIGYEQYSAEFPLRMNCTIHDDSEWLNFHTCARPRCMAAGRRVPFLHGECFWARIYAIPEALVAAGECTFEPPKREEERRFNHIRRLLAPKLRDGLQVRLPAEILIMIAGLLVRECAGITTEEQSRGTEVCDYALDLSRDVYVRYRTVDGLRYVKSLSNTTSGIPDKERRVLSSQEGEAVHKIWIAEDYRGIRHVRFCSSGAALASATPIVNSWWRAISVSGGIQRLTVKTDGLKLRDILTSDGTVSKLSSTYVGWASPDHPTNIVDLTTLGPLIEHPERLRMNSFNCNGRGTTGYTVVSGGFSVEAIHTHGRDDDKRFYAETGASCSDDFFIYMPLDDGEYVTEICRRYASMAVGRSSICLVFITNKGRSTLFGTSGPPDSCRALDRLHTPAPDGSMIYFNDWDSVREASIRYLASDGTQPPIQRPFPPSLIPKSPFFWTQSNEAWLISSCDMEGVVEVTVCRNLTLAHTPIIGMLLEYENGHRECLGQFRFDKCLSKIRVDRGTELYIGSRRTTRSFLYVMDVLTSPPTDRDGGFWMEVSMEGTLEWWSSLRHSILRHTSNKGQFNNMAARV